MQDFYIIFHLASSLIFLRVPGHWYWVVTQSFFLSVARSFIFAIVQLHSFDLLNNLFGVCLGFHNILLNICFVQSSLAHPTGNPGMPFFYHVVKVQVNVRFLVSDFVLQLQIVLSGAFLYSYSFFLFESVH